MGESASSREAESRSMIQVHSQLVCVSFHDSTSCPRANMFVHCYSTTIPPPSYIQDLPVSPRRHINVPRADLPRQHAPNPARLIFDIFHQLSPEVRAQRRASARPSICGGYRFGGGEREQPRGCVTLDSSSLFSSGMHVYSLLQLFSYV